MTAEPNNPRYWASQWYSTKFAEEPWPGGWYWHDNDYNWLGPYDTEQGAEHALQEYLASEQAATAERQRKRAQFSLYYHPLSPYSQKVLIAIQEKGAHIEPHIVELQDETERTRYRKMYPLGQVPVIVLNHGPMIPESSVIIEYMDGLGGPRMISEYADLARKIRFKDRFMDLYLIDSIKLLLEERRKPEPDRDATRLALAGHRVGCVYDFLEHELAGQTWANGEEFSMADCTAAAALAFACDEVSYADYPALSAYAERLGKRPSVQQVRQEAARYSKTASATR